MRRKQDNDDKRGKRIELSYKKRKRYTKRPAGKPTGSEDLKVGPKGPKGWRRRVCWCIRLLAQTRRITILQLSWALISPTVTIAKAVLVRLVYHTPITSPSSLCSLMHHVLPQPHDLLTPQFPVNFQQCLGGLQKTYQERSPCPSTCRPAPGLCLFQRHSCPHSSASPRTPERRRWAYKMA